MNEITHYIESIEKTSERKSVSSVGSKNYAYMQGFTISNVATLLESLALTPEQRKILENHIKELNNIN
jgi:hypothetical protein